MPPESTEPTEMPQPEDAGVVPSQQAPSTDATVIVPARRVDAKEGIGQSAIGVAIQEIGAAFRATATAPQILLSHWAEDLHRRLDKREKELADVREEITAAREDRARLDERLQTIGEKNAAQDLLKVGGGAVIGFGVTQALSGKYVTGGVFIILGVLLAYFGGASIRRWRRNG